MKQETTEVWDNDNEVEIDLVEVFYYLRGKIGWLLFAFVIGAAALFCLTYYLVTPKYTATAKIYMVSASSESVLNLSDLNLGTSLSEDYIELIKIRPVINEVIENLQLDYEYEELLEMVSIGTVGDTRLLAVSVEDTDREEAQQIANEIADTAVTYIPKVMETSTPNIAEYAVLPKKPSSPNLVKNTIGGGLAVMFLLAVIFIVRFLMDDTLKSADDVERAFHTIPLTVIPEGSIDAISDKAEHHSSGKKKRDKKRKK